MNKKKVLFTCTHNRGRSQMAEAFFNEICGEQFEAHSAGLEPGELNPLVVQVMREIGIDISRKQTKAVFDMYKSGKSFAYVVTLCDQTIDERRPVFPGVTNCLDWSFPDPSVLWGTRQQQLARAREIRDAIKATVEQWCATLSLAAAA
jgi:arsenate reductase